MRKAGAAVAQGPRRISKSQADRPAAVRLEFKQVLAAVASLYDDQLKPFGRILLKRVGEHAAAGGGDPAPFVDARRLRRVCESCSRLLVEGQDGGEYVVLLRDRAPDFVDPADALDPYPDGLWQDMAAYFSERGEGSHLPLPGGRYACARSLMARGLPCLAGRSLGEVCHIVALAVAKRRVLGYSDGSTVPFWRSEASLKEICAAHQLPICSAKGTPASLTVASWEATRACLWELLARAEARGGSPGTIQVPNVKRLFRSQFQLELSETALGHSRLQDLLNDPQLSDICEVRQHCNMNVVVKSGGACPPLAAPATALCRASTAGAACSFVGQFGGTSSSCVAPAIGASWHGTSETYTMLGAPPAPGPGVQAADMPYLPHPAGGFGEQDAYCDPSSFMHHAAAYGVAETAFCDQSHLGLGMYGQAPYWEQAPGLWQLPASGSGELAYPTLDDLALPSSECSESPPSCLTNASFFDFLVQEGPSHHGPPDHAFQHHHMSIGKCPTESTANSEGPLSDSEAPEAERDSTHSLRSHRDSEFMSETEGSETPHLRESFWDLMAQEEFGSPSSVTKNTFIHIDTDSLSQPAVHGAAARRRHQSVPCCARLSRGMAQ